jgi:hypothetical protein
VSVVCCQVEVSASGWSLVQRSPTECGVSECDREASTMTEPWPIRAVEPVKEAESNILTARVTNYKMLGTFVLKDFLLPTFNVFVYNNQKGCFVN